MNGIYLQKLKINMCGIAGLIAKDTSMVNLHKLKQMTDMIAHRGPDGEGHWISADGQVGLGHRRLSIIDLSHEADQPMHYLGRYSIVFNGEIYNYIELREILMKQSYVFKTESDTEVLMALYDRDKENCLQLLDGMFAFALFDNQSKQVFIARDRFGEKPFFYSYKKGEYFLFGSEMKCLWAGGIQKEVNNKMLYNYIAFGSLENPNNESESFYENCIKLPHSHYAKLDTETFTLDIQSYYDINWRQVDYSISEQEAKDQFCDLFTTSVKRRLRSDVSVGSSLSGGLDSSLIVCLINSIKKGTSQQQETFSAIFPGFKKNEQAFIEIVANANNVKANYIEPNENELVNQISKLFWHQEEPFGSASIYAQYKVMQLAKERGVTVLLDGQGADEILAGYHPFFNSYFNELKKGDTKTYKYQYQKYLELHANNEINGIQKKSISDQVRDVSKGLVRPAKRLKMGLKQLYNPVFNKDFYQAYSKEVFETPGHTFSTLNESLYDSTFHYGLQVLLRYADRNSMAHSREVRLPFLSHELVDFLFSLPNHFKIHEGWTKWIMRSSFAHILPKEIGWRKDKIGYEPPQKNWMDSAELKNMIKEQRRILVTKNILSPKILNADVMSEDATSSIDKSWIYWMSSFTVT